MILEGLVTSMSADGVVNVAPMGPTVPDDFAKRPERFVLRPFKGSRTLANLLKRPEGVLHVTDDVLLLAEATIGVAKPELEPAEKVPGMRLVDRVRAYEFVIDTLDTRQERSRLEARVVHVAPGREFLGFNRAQFAVVEAAILASRVYILPSGAILAELDRLRVLVEKTAGARETQAFTLLERYIREETKRSSVGADPPGAR